MSELVRHPVVVLNVRDPWVRLPFQALANLVPTLGLLPRVDRWRWVLGSSSQGDGWLREVYYPPRSLGRLAHLLAPLAERSVRAACSEPAAVVFTYPDQRALVDRFPKCAKLYYASDDYALAYGWPTQFVFAWERRIIERADRIVVVSKALADRFRSRYNVPLDRVHVSPNATPADSIPEKCPSAPRPAPAPVPGTFRPLAGVIGRVSSRLELGWLRQAVEALPWLYWVFAGEVTQVDPEHEEEFLALQRHPHCCFTGYQPYDELLRFAEALDVAVIPYNSRGTNPTGSPVRLFAHLGFGQPILATSGCAQLEEFVPLARLCRSAEELIGHLVDLREKGFDDGLRKDRWEAAKGHTWEKRAEGLRRLIEG